MRGGKRTFRRLVPALAAALSVSLLVAGLANAKTVSSVVTLKFVGNAYAEYMTGKVKADNPVCKRKRTVDLFKVKPGKDKLYGESKTSNKGGWQIPPKTSSFPDGRYYAKVKPKSPHGSPNTTCAADKSPRVTPPSQF